MENQEQVKFEEWAILELFGHQRIAGLVTAISIGGASFVRVDVPDIEQPSGAPPKLTKFLSPAAIYAITPVTEETVRASAKACSAAPVTRWDVQDYLKLNKKQLVAVGELDAEDEGADELPY